jgi:hypothetical protein
MQAGSAGELKRRIVMSDGQTHGRSEFIYKISKKRKKIKTKNQKNIEEKRKRKRG